MWHEEIKVSILFFNPYIIHAKVEHETLPYSWYLSCMYGPPYHNQKTSFWTELECMSDSIEGPWLLIGDFNELVHSCDKKGGRNLYSLNHSFLESFISASGLIELGILALPLPAAIRE